MGIEFLPCGMCEDMISSCDNCLFQKEAKELYNEIYNQALEDVYLIIISDIEDKEKVLKIQELVFAKKGISNCESERI